MTRPHHCFAVVAPGLELLAGGELLALGIEPGESETGGVSFAADSSQLYRANLELRTASRILVRLAHFRATAFWELEKQASRVLWTTVVPAGGPVTFSVTSRRSRLYHQKGIAERLTRAVSEMVDGAHAGDSEASQLFVVRVDRDEMTISTDSSGALLHQRGYRLATAKAPLRETLAAAMLLGAGWDGSTPLLDPLCGSGTIPIEAALIAARIAPGLERHFAFEQWPSFDGGLWRRVKSAARSRIDRSRSVSITGSDRDGGAIEAARQNASRAGVSELVQLERRSLSAAATAAPDGGWVITNPPYGVRVGEAEQLRDLYARLGQVITRLPKWSAGLLTANPRLVGQLALPVREVWRSKNGGIPVRYLVFEPGVSA